MKATIGDIVLCRYTGYHRSGEDHNAAVITSVVSGGDPSVEKTVVTLTIFAQGTVPFDGGQMVLKGTDDGSDRQAWVKAVPV